MGRPKGSTKENQKGTIKFAINKMMEDISLRDGNESIWTLLFEQMYYRQLKDIREFCSDETTTSLIDTVLSLSELGVLTHNDGTLYVCDAVYEVLDKAKDLVFEIENPKCNIDSVNSALMSFGKACLEVSVVVEGKMAEVHKHSRNLLKPIILIAEHYRSRSDLWSDYCDYCFSRCM